MSFRTAVSLSRRHFSKQALCLSCPNGDFGPNKEFSVVYTSSSLNHMSPQFKKVMNSLNATLTSTYNCPKAIVLPGSGTFAMEAVARQFGENEDVLVIRNGWFSYRWTEIFEAGRLTPVNKVMNVVCATPEHTDWLKQPQIGPPPIESVIDQIKATKPKVVFAPHVETSTGIILPDEYIKQIADACHSVGGLLILDAIASGTVWVDMTVTGVDVLISAPQKGWSGSAGAAMVMMSNAAAQRLAETSNSSYSMSLNKWDGIMQAYLGGEMGYHTTMPTDILRALHNSTVRKAKIGFEELKQMQLDLGMAVRDMMDARGLVSVAQPAYAAPGVLVYYTPKNKDGQQMSNAEIVGKFLDERVQIAAGVPWRIGEPDDVRTFRIGLFGMDKLKDVTATLSTVQQALDKVVPK